MDYFCSIMHKSRDYEKLKESIKQKCFPVMAVGMSPVHKALTISSICKDISKKALIVTPDESSAQALSDDLESLGTKTVILPVRDFSLRDMGTVSHDYEQVRTNTLFKLIKGDFCVCIAPCQSAFSLTVPPKIIEQNTVSVTVGDTVSPDSLSQMLISAGYIRSDVVDGAGQFAIRGGIADVFGAGETSPVRIEFFGDEIDCLYLYDNLTGRRTDKINSAIFVPAREVLCDNETLCEKLQSLTKSKKKISDKAIQRITMDCEMAQSGVSFPLDRYLNILYDTPGTVFDYVGDALLFICDTAGIESRRKSYESLFKEEFDSLFDDGYIVDSKPKFFLKKDEYFEIFKEKGIFLETFSRSSFGIPLKELYNFSARQIPSFSGEISILADDINTAKKHSDIIVVLGGVLRAAEGLCEELNRLGIKATFCEKPESGSKGVTVTVGGLSSGVELCDAGVTVFTHTAVRRVKKRRPVSKNAAPIGSLEELKVGDLVVHAAHGIGIFGGVHRINSHGVIKDYIKIGYAKSDVLYVPVTQLDTVSRYIGNADDSTVKLNRLGTQEWQRTRTKVKAAVRDLADKLIKLYATRMSQKGYAFPPDDELQRDFECRFEYEETPDQLRCAREIKDDMERPVPMDRLLCGDVGFGKTEVALRAAFKCVENGKQCALLVPTTILAFQHYQTVLRRFGELPVNTEMLSRFVSPSKQREVLKGLKDGSVDFVIGTHRTISKDVEFRDLGLLIIDEEQRFGVAQKEKLKERYPSVDILTLSATPIPRTLNMAVSGIRDMSSIDEAPEDRYPVVTYVLEQDNALLAEAIKRELRRGGQVYYLHNRVESIYATATRLKEMIPESRIDVAHGKMSEDELSGVWERLINHEIDVLVCTTIIETGVDVSNVNTLIIENAERMGLAQLHQLRGRVGRSPRRAYAYFCFKRGAALTEIAEKRLQAIKEYTEFGSGFKIAMRDLEIRGAGDLLGSSQHGHMAAVGYDTYIKLLQESISEQRGEPIENKTVCTLDLDISAHIPESYMPALSHRMYMYRRIADISNEAEYDDVLDELRDRFGEPPKAVTSLMEIALLRRKATDVGITEVKQFDGKVRLYLENLRPEYTLALASKFGKRLAVNKGERPCYIIAVSDAFPSKRIVQTVVDLFIKAN